MAYTIFLCLCTKEQLRTHVTNKWVFNFLWLRFFTNADAQSDVHFIQKGTLGTLNYDTASMDTKSNFGTSVPYTIVRDLMKPQNSEL